MERAFGAFEEPGVRKRSDFLSFSDPFADPLSESFERRESKSQSFAFAGERHVISITFS